MFLALHQFGTRHRAPSTQHSTLSTQHSTLSTHSGRLADACVPRHCFAAIASHLAGYTSFGRTACPLCLVAYPGARQELPAPYLRFAHPYSRASLQPHRQFLLPVNRVTGNISTSVTSYGYAYLIFYRNLRPTSVLSSDQALPSVMMGN